MKCTVTKKKYSAKSGAPTYSFLEMINKLSLNFTFKKAHEMNEKRLVAVPCLFGKTLFKPFIKALEWNLKLLIVTICLLQNVLNTCTVNNYCLVW